MQICLAYVPAVFRTARIKLSRWTGRLWIAAVFLAIHSGLASNGNIRILEVMAGANGDSRIQFIVVEQGAEGENQWGPQGNELQSRAMLVFFDALGRETGKFKFPANPPTGGTLKTLIATPEFAKLPGAPAPDIVIPPLLNAVSGKVCFRNNPSNAMASPRNECVSYGGFAGDTEVNRGAGADVPAGPPAPELPIVDAVSLRRMNDSGRNSAFVLKTSPTPVNIDGASFIISVAPATVQGEALFNNETFSGNGRTCASCHVAADGFGLSPATVQSRFAALIGPESSYDPLFIGESAPSAFDKGFDFNLNTLVLAAEVATPAPCIGELRGRITSENGGRAKVLTRISPTSYLVYGGFNPPLTGAVTDGMCSGVVARVTAGDLAPSDAASAQGLEDPWRMRGVDSAFPEGRALILENIDGFANPPVFRRSPHLLNLAYTAPYGFSGEFPDLRTFVTGAIRQHFPRTLARSSGPNPDFRLPSPEELAALEAFLLAQEFPSGDDPNKFDLTRFATTELQREGQEDFVVFGCAACHGGPALSQTTISIQGKAAGVNASFATGTTELSEDSLPCEPPIERLGSCGSREFSTPQLFNLSALGPYFHNGSARTLAEAVGFYLSSEFGTSPANVALIFQGVGVVATDAITAFLAGLVPRPYTLSEGPLRFGARSIESGPSDVKAVAITNAGSSVLRFDSAACRLEGADPFDFRITSCPLAPVLAGGESRTIQVTFAPGSSGPKSAILEIHPREAVPSGIDLFGVGGAPRQPPSLTEVEPKAGSPKGGDFVILRGSNFANGAEVRIGGVRAGFVSVLNSTTISARAGARSPGTADVMVINPDGQTAVLANAYTYTLP